MHTTARGLTTRPEPGQVAGAVEIGNHAAGEVVRRGGDRQEVERGVETDGAHRAPDRGKTLGEVGDFRGVEPHVVEAALDAAARDRPGHHVAGCEVGERVLLRHEREAIVVAQDRAFAAQRLRQQQTRARRVVEGSWVELHELHIGHCDAGPKGHRDAVAGGDRRIGGDREALACATGGDHRVAGPHLTRRAGGVERAHANRAATLHQEVGDEPALADFDVEFARRGREGALDLGAGGVAACVDDAGDGVPAFTGLGQGRAEGVESGAERDQLTNAVGSFGHQYPHCIHVTEMRTGGDGVGEV